jgi:uncharacterized protein with PIN domain
VKGQTPKFLVDENVRGLGRWLRFLGLDAEIAAGQSDKELASRAQKEGRLLLTRDHELAEALGKGAVFLNSAKSREQLAELFKKHKCKWPDQKNWFSRCVVCNAELREMEEAEEKNLAPPGYTQYWACDGCGRTYWRGSHYARTLRFLSEIRSV